MEQRDSFSYQCGVVDAFNEMVAAEVKALALSHPMDTREEMEALIAYAHESCRRHGTKLYPECDPLITDLFPASLNRGKYNILFYKADHVIEEYIRLKDRKAAACSPRTPTGSDGRPGVDKPARPRYNVAKR